MESKEFIESALVSRTNAGQSNVEAKNNRWHYKMTFDQSIGWDWLYQQVYKCSKELEAELELWEIHPSTGDTFQVEVREVDRREGIDNSQKGLDSFAR